jgi:hypothetical protein
MVDLISVGMHETNGVLIHLQNGKATQVRLEKDKAGVQYRVVPAEEMDDTEDGDPKWINAFGYILGQWRSSNSMVWQWLKEKGLDDAASVARQLGMRGRGGARNVA